MPPQKKRFSVDTAWFDEQFSLAKTSIRAVAWRGRFCPSNLSRVLHGKIPLNLACAIVLADAFGVPIEEIIEHCGFQPPRRKSVKTRKNTINALISKAKIATLRHPDK